MDSIRRRVLELTCGPRPLSGVLASAAAAVAVAAADFAALAALKGAAAFAALAPPSAALLWPAALIQLLLEVSSFVRSCLHLDNLLGMVS